MPLSSGECNICGSHELEERAIYGTVYLCCSKCGITYLGNMPTQEELNKYYETEYKIALPDGTNNEIRRMFRLPEQCFLIAEIMNYREPPTLIIDIGCDKGYFLDEARRWGYSVLGIEPSESGRQYCRNIGIEVLKHHSDCIQSAGIVVMWHSLEHFVNPVQVLRQLYSILEPDGLIFVRVPAFDNIWRKIFGKRWIWFQPQNHYYHYNAASLRAALASAGFDVLSVEHRKPNNRFTKRSFRLAGALFSRLFNKGNSFRSRVRQFYEDVTGVEIFAVAKKRK